MRLLERLVCLIKGHKRMMVFDKVIFPKDATLIDIITGDIPGEVLSKHWECWRCGKHLGGGQNVRSIGV